MPDFTVARRGTDSSGRGIFATAFMWMVWLAVLAHPDVRPFAHKIVITQGAFMRLAGGGAKGSEGYHDGAGTFDLRVWNLTAAEITTLIRVLRLFGCAAYLRNEQHGGFDDPHIHFVLGADRPLSEGAAAQWADYLDDRDGLASNGPDYHPRPRPLVLTPPDHLLEDDMANYAEQLDRIEAQNANIIARLRNSAIREKNTAALLRKVRELVKDDATRAQVDAVLAELDVDE